MNKTVIVVATLATAAGIVAVYQTLQLRSEREQNRELLARVATLESARPLQQTMALPAAPAITPEDPAAPAGQAVAPPAARKPAERAANPLMAGMQQMMNSPEGQEFTRSMTRAMLPQMYPDLAKELNLTPAEAEKLFDLLAKHQNDLGMESMGLLGGGPQDPAAMQDMMRKVDEKQRANEAELAAALGSKYPQWQEYQSTQAARQEVNQLREALSSTDTPLTAAQSKSLITAFTTEQKRIDQEQRVAASSTARNSPNMMDDELQRATDHQRRFVDVAANHLTATQLEEYKRHVDQQQDMMRTMMRAMGGMGGKEDTP